MKVNTICILLDNGTRVRADHFMLYASTPMLLETYMSSLNTFSWRRCDNVPATGVMVLVKSLVSEDDQPDFQCVYALQLLTYLWEHKKLSMNERLLVCHLHDVLATKKKPLEYLGHIVLLPLYSILACADFTENRDMMFRIEQVASTIRNILIEVHVSRCCNLILLFNPILTPRYALHYHARVLSHRRAT
jgi:hypothetical protein